jgi:sterol desaturase/sphingolipid hydroxylase (fatty acid hydroxylase superfamily)
MKMSKFAYFSEFLLFPSLILIATLLALHRPMPARPAILVMVYGAAIVCWTLIEYLLHRVLFHHAPILSRIHDRHHQSPQELIGTPGWLSVLIGLIAVAGPSWATFGLDFGTAATAGLVTGYLWYVFVHYAVHQWQPRRNSYLYRARLRHARHHYLSHDGNFGVTTGIWDWVFGTALEAREPGLHGAGRRLRRREPRQS